MSLLARSSPGTLVSPRFDAVEVDSEEARAPISSRPSALMSVRGDELISGLTGTAIAAVELESPNVVTMTAAAQAATEGTRILIVSAFVREVREGGFYEVGSSLDAANHLNISRLLHIFGVS